MHDGNTTLLTNHCLGGMRCGGHCQCLLVAKNKVVSPWNLNVISVKRLFWHTTLQSYLQCITQCGTTVLLDPVLWGFFMWSVD